MRRHDYGREVATLREAARRRWRPKPPRVEPMESADIFVGYFGASLSSQDRARFVAEFSRAANGMDAVERRMVALIELLEVWTQNEPEDDSPGS
jgi:hypothetical protein